MDVHDITGFQRDILYIINGVGPTKGLDIKDELEKYYPSTINHGRLYPNLDTLVEMGLVEKGQLDERTNSYSLTRRGVQALETRRAWEDTYLAEADSGE